MPATANNASCSKVDEIIAQLDLSQGADPNANRRQAPRVRMRTTMTARLLTGTADASLIMYSRNLSTSGIGFLCRRSCKAGERIALSFDLPDRPRKLVLAQITFCRYLRAGLYEVGAEFKECVTCENGNQRVPSHWIPKVRAGSGHAPGTPGR